MQRRPKYPGRAQPSRAGCDTPRQPSPHKARAPAGIVGREPRPRMVQRSPNPLDVAVVGETEMLQHLPHAPAALRRRPVELPAIERTGNLTYPPTHVAQIGEPLRPLLGL